MELLFQHIDQQDSIALLFFIACWGGYALYCKRQTKYESLISIANKYRLEWMRSMLRRENRSVDAILIGNLMRSITFSANTTIFILAGLIGMLSYQKEVGDIIGAIPYSKPMTSVMWEVKIFLLILIFIYAFFKYTWSIRQQNYTSIVVGSAPLDTEIKPEHDAIAQKAAFLSGNAADHFNSGLRAYYFGLAALAWFVHPYCFMLATAMVVYVTHHREYRSRTLQRLVSNA